MAALFNPPRLPSVQAVPPPPSLDTKSVSKAAQDALTARAQAKGRASTYLTNAMEQREADPSAQRYLGAA